MKKSSLLFAAVLLFSATLSMYSCAEKNEKTEEVSRMDSVSKSVEKSSDELEKKTEELEEALKDLDKEIEN